MRVFKSQWKFEKASSAKLKPVKNLNFFADPRNFEDFEDLFFECDIFWSIQLRTRDPQGQAMHENTVFYQ